MAKKPPIARHFDVAKILAQVDAAVKAAEATGNPAVVAATQKALIDRADDTTRPVIEALFTKVPEAVKSYADDPIVGDKAIREATELVRNTREYETAKLQKKNLRLIAQARKQVNAIPKTREVTVNANDLYGSQVMSLKLGDAKASVAIPREGTVTIQEDLTGVRQAFKAEQIAKSQAEYAADSALRGRLKATKDAKGAMLRADAIKRAIQGAEVATGVGGGVITSIKPKAALAVEKVGETVLKTGAKAAGKGVLGRVGSFLFGPWGTAIAAGLTAKELLIDPVLEQERADRLGAVEAILRGRDAMDFLAEEHEQGSLQRSLGRLQVAQETAALEDAAAVAKISGLMSPEEKGLLGQAGVAYQPAPWEIYNRMSQ